MEQITCGEETENYRTGCKRETSCRETVPLSGRLFRGLTSPLAIVISLRLQSRVDGDDENFGSTSSHRFASRWTLRHEERSGRSGRVAG